MVKKTGIDHCQICLKKADELPKGRALEGHHLEEYSDGGGSVEDGNIIVACTACHRLIHWIRTYH